MENGGGYVTAVQLFIEGVRNDLSSPTTSNFGNRLSLYKDAVHSLTEVRLGGLVQLLCRTALQNQDFDAEGLSKLRKAVKCLQEAASSLYQSEQDMVLALDRLANLNAANSLANDVDPDISKHLCCSFCSNETESR